jgi:RNA polymerase sigma-70 factor (ECF subfamily)
MNEHDVLAERFETHRPRLRALAYQTLGSTTEADDAVQETWLRLSRSDSGTIENLGGWLTTVVARVCLNMLAARRDEPVGVVLPEPVASDADGSGPEHEALLADSIGPALLVILHTLALPRQRAITDAFLIAARDGDFDALLEALDQDVVLRSNGTEVLRGASTVAARAFPFTRIAQVTVPALINGAVGIITAADSKPVTLVGFTVTGQKITAIDLVDNPRRIAEADLAVLG